MTTIVTYDADGKITGRIKLSSREDLALYSNYVEISEDDFSKPVDMTHRVNTGTLQLEPKQVVTVAINKGSIDADGADEAIVTFLGLVGDAVALVNGKRVPISPADNTIAITSNAATSFAISLMPDNEHILSGAVALKAQ